MQEKNSSVYGLWHISVVNLVICCQSGDNIIDLKCKKDCISASTHAWSWSEIATLQKNRTQTMWT